MVSKNQFLNYKIDSNSEARGPPSEGREQGSTKFFLGQRCSKVEIDFKKAAPYGPVQRLVSKAAIS